VSLGVCALMAAFLVGPTHLITSGCGSQSPTVQFGPTQDLSGPLGIEGAIMDSVGVDYFDYGTAGFAVGTFVEHVSGGAELHGSVTTQVSAQVTPEFHDSRLVYFRVDEDGNVLQRVRLDVEGFEINRHPDIVVAGEEDIYVAWQDNSAGPDEWNVWVRHSVDGGASWGAPVQVNDVPTGAPDQPIDIAYEDPNMVFVSWTRLDNAGHWIPVLDVSPTTAPAFGADLELGVDPSEHAEGTSPHVAVDEDGYAYVTWHEGTGVDDFRVDREGCLNRRSGWNSWRA